MVNKYSHLIFLLASFISVSGQGQISLTPIQEISYRPSEIFVQRFDVEPLVPYAADTQDYADIPSRTPADAFAKYWNASTSQQLIDAQWSIEKVAKTDAQLAKAHTEKASLKVTIPHIITLIDGQDSSAFVKHRITKNDSLIFAAYTPLAKKGGKWLVSSKEGRKSIAYGLAFIKADFLENSLIRNLPANEILRNEIVNSTIEGRIHWPEFIERLARLTVYTKNPKIVEECCVDYRKRDFDPSTFSTSNKSFKIVLPTIDTIGQWVGFYKKTAPTDFEDYSFARPETYASLCQRLFTAYLVDSTSLLSESGLTEIEVSNVNSTVEPTKAITYAAVLNSTVTIRYVDQRSKSEKVIEFNKSGDTWRARRQSQRQLFKYMQYIPARLNSRLSSFIAVVDGSVKTLQQNCADVIYPYFTQVSCVVELIESQNLMADPEFVKGLK